MAAAEDLLRMRGIAKQLDEWLPYVDEIDAMSAIRLDEAACQVRQWLDRYEERD